MKNETSDVKDLFKMQNRQKQKIKNNWWDQKGLLLTIQTKDW